VVFELKRPVVQGERGELTKVMTEPDLLAEANRPPLQRGTLYLVATPIGNLEDITFRALRTLKQCDLVAAEDTRRTGLLLHHFGLKKPLLSCFHFNETQRSAEIVERLKQGQIVALVSDAGSPGISDPGQRLVQRVLEAGCRVESVPGPCALVAALTASGLPTDEFHFVGFLPHKSGARRRRLEQLQAVPGTLALYESPHRLPRLLGELSEIFPDRTVVVARELTKKFEQYLRGRPAELKAELGKTKGEFVVLIEGAAPDGKGSEAVDGEDTTGDEDEPPTQSDMSHGWT